MTHLKVREIAESKGLNISTLSRRADLAYTTAHTLWHDKAEQFNRRTLDRVALALGVTVADLFGGKPESEDEKSAAAM
jgi:DNA-binding Xre family transcriptional regulator